jgi:hypothetical protein
VYDRPAGLAGIWGSLIRDWLEELLPADAAERCAGRVRLVVTEVPSLRIRYLENFESKQDLIDANSESVDRWRLLLVATAGAAPKHVACTAAGGRRPPALPTLSPHPHHLCQPAPLYPLQWPLCTSPSSSTATPPAPTAAVPT